MKKRRTGHAKDPNSVLVLLTINIECIISNCFTYNNLTKLTTRPNSENIQITEFKCEILPNQIYRIGSK